MLGWAFTFFVVAVAAAILAFGGFAGTAVGTVRIVFFVAAGLFLLSTIAGALRGRRS